MLRDRGTPPKPDFRLVGVIEGAEQVVVKGGNGRLDGQGGGGWTSTNGGANFDRGRTLTAITIALTLETPDSLDVEGASARYRIFVEQTESNRGVELYMGGNGFGLGSRLRITQDSSDAIYDLMAMSLIQILGTALRIPYDRCDAQFHRDAALERRVRQDFGGLTDLELEDELRRFMLVEGFKIGRQQGPLQSTDQAMLMLEMQHRGLRVDRAGMLEMAMQFWRGMNYLDGANRVAEIHVENNLRARQYREQEAIQQAALRVDPREFGFAPGPRIIVVDLSRMAARTCCSRSAQHSTVFHLRRSALASAEAADWNQHRHEGVGDPVFDQKHALTARVCLVTCAVAAAPRCSIGWNSTAGDIGDEVAAPPGCSTRYPVSGSQFDHGRCACVICSDRRSARPPHHSTSIG